MHGNKSTLLATLQLPANWSNEYVRNAGERILYYAGLNSIGFTSNLYDHHNPTHGGMTFVWFLSESHMILETFREHALAELEIVTCQGSLRKDWKNIIHLSGLDPLAITLLEKDGGHQWRA